MSIFSLLQVSEVELNSKKKQEEREELVAKKRAEKAAAEKVIELSFVTKLCISHHKPHLADTLSLLSLRFGFFFFENPEPGHRLHSILSTLIFAADESAGAPRSDESRGPRQGGKVPNLSPFFSSSFFAPSLPGLSSLMPCRKCCGRLRRSRKPCLGSATQSSGSR